MFYKDPHRYSRNRAVGMSYLNRMIIEEESQFECDGVYETDSEIGQKCTLNRISKPDSNAHHIIIAAEPSSFEKFFFRWWGTLPESYRTYGNFFGFMNASGSDMIHVDRNSYQGGINTSLRNSNVMITLLESERLKCVENEKAKRFYREGGQIENESETLKDFPLADAYPTIETHTSIGDDAENFFERIVQGRIVPNNLDINRPFIGELDDFFYGLWATQTYWNKKQYIHAFHLSMLSDDEEKYLNSSEASLYGVFKFRTIMDKNATNFSLSVCLRKTFILQGEILYGITEPDPWQERIMKDLPEWLQKNRSSLVRS